MRPSQCRAYLRNALAREFRGIVQGFVEGAKSGSCQHVKLATELVRPPERRKRNGKGELQRLVDQLEREARQKSQVVKVTMLCAGPEARR